MCTRWSSWVPRACGRPPWKPEVETRKKSGIQVPFSKIHLATWWVTSGSYMDQSFSANPLLFSGDQNSGHGSEMTFLSTKGASGSLQVPCSAVLEQSGQQMDFPASRSKWNTDSLPSAPGLKWAPALLPDCPNQMAEPGVWQRGQNPQREADALRKTAHRKEVNLVTVHFRMHFDAGHTIL